MAKSKYHWITYGRFILIGIAAVWKMIRNSGMIEVRL